MAEEDVTAEAQDVPGHVPPEPGVEDAPESEIPVGADSLTDEQMAKAEEAGPVGGGDEGDGGALDVSALMEDSGDDAGDEGADATPDDDVAEPDNTGEDA